MCSSIFLFSTFPYYLDMNFKNYKSIYELVKAEISQTQDPEMEPVKKPYKKVRVDKDNGKRKFVLTKSEGAE